MDYKKMYEEMKQENEKLQEYTDTLTGSPNTIDELIEYITEVNSSYTELQEENEELKAENEKLKDLLELEKDKLQQSSNELSMALDMNTDLKISNHLLEKENEELKKQIKEQKKKTLKLKLDLMGARNMKQNRDFEIEKVKGQLEMVWNNYHNLEEENEELKKKSEEGNFENIMLFIETWNVMGFRSIEKKEEFCEKYKISLKRFNEMYKIHNLVYKKNFMEKDDTFLPESQDVGGLDTE